MSSDPKRNRARELAAHHLDRGDALGWFEALYAEAAGNSSHVPWADLRPNPNLVEWFEEKPIEGKDRPALVVGCGLGDDAEFLAQEGFRVTAFDVSPTAIDWCQKRFPGSSVDLRGGRPARPADRLAARLRLRDGGVHAAGLAAPSEGAGHEPRWPTRSSRAARFWSSAAAACRTTPRDRCPGPCCGKSCSPSIGRASQSTRSRNCGTGTKNPPCGASVRATRDRWLERRMAKNDRQLAAVRPLVKLKCITAHGNSSHVKGRFSQHRT